MRRGPILACFAAVTCAGPAAASPAPSRLDRLHGVRFDLSGAVLTVSLVPGSGADTREQVWGRRIRAVCSPTFDYRKVRRVAVWGVQLWPAGATELTYTFDRDISDRVKWCLLEDRGGGDIADVDFAPFIPVYADTAKDRRIGQRLSRYLWRNAGSTPWINRLTGIVVDDGVIAVATQLRPNRRGKRIAGRICGLIAASDVADTTPGHAVYGRGDVVLRACSERP